MATNSLMLSIPNPCSENWNNMTPQEKGRFCDTCQKCVVDFTAMTDAAVLDYFNKNNGKICGRFDKRQLDRVLIINDKRFQKRFNIAASLLLLSSLGFGNTVKNDAISPLKVLQFDTQKRVAKKPLLQPNEPTLTDSFITLKGNIYTFQNNQKESIPGVYLTIKNFNLSSQSDVDGNFIITIPTLALENGALIVQYIGFKTVELPLSKLNLKENILIELKEDDMSLSGDIIIRRPSLWKRFTNLFRRKGHKKW
jgi:CarboxypepD_reg-like domain